MTRSIRVYAGSFQRPGGGPVWESGPACLPLSREPAWQSNGGPLKHPDRGLPFTLEVPVPPIEGDLLRVTFAGVFALYADASLEPPGTVGASILLMGSEGDVLAQTELINGRHYRCANDLSPTEIRAGDGTSVETVGAVDGMRVDLLTLDVPTGCAPVSVTFKDLGTPASFLIFDVFVEFSERFGCPFRSGSGGVALSEIPSILRLRDRVRFTRALDQLEASLAQAEDLDEARGEALTFLAMLTAGMLELGGERQMHRAQLDAAREFDSLDRAALISARVRDLAEGMAAPLFRQVDSPSAPLIERALAIIERHFARELSDEAIARQLGLSTSHFRYLFRQATGQPFHRYLVAVRLEKARRLLLEQDMPVSQIASAVGFTGLSHFSRAFSQRFSVSPTTIRRSSVAR